MFKCQRLVGSFKKAQRVGKVQNILEKVVIKNKKSDKRTSGIPNFRTVLKEGTELRMHILILQNKEIHIHIEGTVDKMIT